MNIPATLSERLSTDARATSAPARFGVALLAVVLALLMARVLPFSDGPNGFGGSVPYLVALVAVEFSSWYCGTWPSIAAAALSLVSIDFWFVPPTHSQQIMRAEDWWNNLAFLSAAAVIVIIGEANQRQRRRMRDAAGKLEENIRERTTELDRSNESLRQLTARLMTLQDEERRRIARELHDNAGQALSALAINLGEVEKGFRQLIKTAGMVADSTSMVQELSAEIRTMSYLLHPPLLDEVGLVSALQWYVEGFAERSKIAVEFECAEDLGRLSPEVETAIFRLVQECLTNIHRHSGSPTAAIRIEQPDGRLRVEISDRGKGLSPDIRDQMGSGGTLGVGIRGMRERVQQLGGSLEINSNGIGTGTRVIVQLPVAAQLSATELPATEPTPTPQLPATDATRPQQAAGFAANA